MPEQIKREEISSPLQVLSSEFIRRRSKNPLYSLRRFAEHLGIPSGRLSEILNGKRALSYKQALKIASSLNMRPAETSALLECLGNSDKNPKKVSVPQSELVLQEEIFTLITEWYHYAILSLIRTDDFDPRPKVIARRLGISSIEASTALRRLENLNLIQKQKGSWQRTYEPITTSWDIPSSALRKAHEQDLQQAITALYEVPAKEREISSFTFPSSPSMVPKAKKQIRNFLKKLSKQMESGKCTEVYNLNIQLIPVTRRKRK